MSHSVFHSGKTVILRTTLPEAMRRRKREDPGRTKRRGDVSRREGMSDGGTEVELTSVPVDVERVAIQQRVVWEDHARELNLFAHRRTYHRKKGAAQVSSSYDSSPCTHSSELDPRVNSQVPSNSSHCPIPLSPTSIILSFKSLTSYLLISTSFSPPFPSISTNTSLLPLLAFVAACNLILWLIRQSYPSLLPPKLSPVVLPRQKMRESVLFSHATRWVTFWKASRGVMRICGDETYLERTS